MKQGDVAMRQCPKSFSSNPEDLIESIDVEGWGRCMFCGEVVNTRGKLVPEHQAPAERISSSRWRTTPSDVRNSPQID